MKKYVKHVVMVSFLFASSIVIGSSGLGPELSDKQKEIVDQYRLDYIKASRWPRQQDVPPFYKLFIERYKDYCLNMAQKEYEKTGRWFYCQDYKKFGMGYLRWDEQLTYKIYWMLLDYYGGLEKIPNCSRENREKAIKFWQSWQKPDGSFHNPFDKEVKINYKYVPSVLELLGARPLYESVTGASQGGKSKIDVKAILEKCTTFHGLNGGAAAISTLFTKVHEGKVEYIPVVERGIEIFLSRLNSKTGLFHENKIPEGKEWSDYATTGNHFKCIARIVGYSGAENFPYRRQLADVLIANQRYFQADDVDVPVIRNTAELYMLCLEQSAYRRKELLKALARNAEAFQKDEPWKDHLSGGYIMYSIRMFGPFLNWKGYDTRDKLPRTPHYHGIANSYRIVIGPFGRCANIIKKAPDEMPWHKGWSIEKYGLLARNAGYAQRRVVDIMPVCKNDDWKSRKDADGRFVLTRTFNLKNAGLENPYLKIDWMGGDIEIYINGVFVKKKLAGLDEPKDPGLNKFGAIYIPPKARETLKKGENTVTIKSSPNVDTAPLVRIGLIDWVMPKN